MCGFAGVLSLNNKKLSFDDICAMTKVIAHRGPDDYGYSFFSLNSESEQCSTVSTDISNCGLFTSAFGFVRLSIQDLSVAGHQPMQSKDNKISLVFNGEIYNAPELRKMLISLGVNFKGHSDTEVLLNMYLQFGLEKMLDQVNGMFSICIVNLFRKEVYLIRDRFGIKPLYWSKLNGQILIASEVKSFLSYPNFVPELEHDFLDEYLTFRYLSGSNHLLKGVKQVNPGHFIKISPEKIEEFCYYNLSRQISNSKKLSLNNDESAHELEKVLENSVKSHLLSDAPIGIQLSGGIDSSLIAILASRANPKLSEAFSISFTDPNFDESRWASKIASLAGVDSHSFILNSTEIVDFIDKCSWHLDQPLNHPNSLGLFLLAKRANSYVKVLLAGDGADEVFGGYPRYYYAQARNKYKFLKYLSYLFSKRNSLYSNLKPYLEDEEYIISMSMFTDFQDIEKIYPNYSKNRAFSKRKEIFSSLENDFFDKQRLYEILTFLPDCLIKQDKMCMANSIESRVPFLDHNLVEYAFSLKNQYLVDSNLLNIKFKSLSTKKILKKLTLKFTSDEFVYRSKQGFGLPLRDYFRSPETRNIINENYLEPLMARSLFDSERINFLWQNIDSLDLKSIEMLWILISFESWAKVFKI